MTPADIISGKAPLPTALSSAEIRARIGADILRRSVFSARATERGFLDLLRDTLLRLASGALSDRDAELELRGWLDEAGYAPPDGQAGGLADRTSHGRMRLVLNTSSETAAGAAMAQAQDTLTLDAYPAWRLIRLGYTRDPRDWEARWREAGRSVGWRGAARETFVARKDSPIWQALGDGTGGYSDTFGNPYPPFAFSSRMTWEPVARSEAESLGVSGSPAPSGATLSPGERELVEAARRHGPAFAADAAAELEGL